ncbi:MAG: hypothetical protein MUC49_02545 [Raineya sp.]|jgi:hypothetical protein|nr:hypothetical protein [Raineya sp.]
MSKRKYTDNQIINQLITNQTNKNYWVKISWLRSKPSQELFDKCVELIASPNAKSRIIGIDILAQLGLSTRPFFKETSKIFFQTLHNEKDIKVIRSLLFAIGHNNHKMSQKQIKILCSFSDNPHQDIREGLTFALLGVKDSKAIDTLIKLSGDKLSKIRNWATFGLGDFTDLDNEDIQNALQKRLKDKHLETRYEAVLGLAKRKHHNILEIIESELLKNNYSTLLYEAVMITQNRFFLPLLEKQLHDAQEDNDIPSECIEKLKECINFLYY